MGAFGTAVVAFGFTDAEVIILGHLANGRKSREIAELMGLHENCIGQRIHVMKNKVGAATSCGMIARAFRAGLLR